VKGIGKNEGKREEKARKRDWRKGRKKGLKRRTENWIGEKESNSVHKEGQERDWRKVRKRETRDAGIFASRTSMYKVEKLAGTTSIINTKIRRNSEKKK
jgi:hypothetical protein